MVAAPHQNEERMRLLDVIIINYERELLNRVVMMAGVDGFEPPHDGIKNRCLTAWLHPKIPKNNLSILKFNCQEKL